MKFHKRLAIAGRCGRSFLKFSHILRASNSTHKFLVEEPRLERPVSKVFDSYHERDFNIALDKPENNLILVTVSVLLALG